MALNVERVRVLVEVVHSGSIAAAAKRMGFTASALSQQLAKLEREVGEQLVERGPGGVRPTATGRALVRHGERVLGALHDAEEAVRSARQVTREHVSLGTFASAGKALVPAALAGFRRDHPQVRLSLFDIEPPGGYGLIMSGDLDLLITHRYPQAPLPAAAGLRRAHLMTDPLRVVLPAGHRCTGSGALPLRALAREEWISGGPDAPNRSALDKAARRAGIDLRVAYETRDYAVTLALLSAGIGVALVPNSIVRAAQPGDYAVRDLDQSIARQIFLVHRPRPRPPISDMVAHLEEVSCAASSPWPFT